MCERDASRLVNAARVSNTFDARPTGQRNRNFYLCNLCIVWCGNTQEYLYPRRPSRVGRGKPPQPLVVRPRETRRTHRRTLVNYNYRYRLRPSDALEEQLAWTVDTCRQVYNHFLHRLNRSDDTSAYTEQKRLPDLKKWVVSQSPLEFSSN